MSKLQELEQACNLWYAEADRVDVAGDRQTAMRLLVAVRALRDHAHRIDGYRDGTETPAMAAWMDDPAERGWGMSKAIGDVTAERARQITHEWWTKQHDDGHTNGQLARAAIAYILDGLGSQWGQPLGYWPWDPEEYNPDGHRRNLVRAAALIVAEIERLDRAERVGEE